MKLKHLIFTMLPAAMLLAACSTKGGDASTGKTEAAAEQPAAEATPTLDLTFLKNMGVDVAGIHGIDEENEAFDVANLDEPQLRKLWPMVAYMNVDEVLQGHCIKGAKPLAGGLTMLLFGADTGDDSSTELLAVYDKDGTMTDYMQLGDYDAFVVLDSDDDFTSGTAQAVDTKITFPTASEFVIDRTEKEGSWVSDEDLRPGKLTDVKWLIQTVGRYKVDGKGRISLVEQKEVKREGKVPADRDATFDNIFILPASTPGRIDRLNDAINSQVKKQGRDAYLEDMPYDVQMTVAECFAADPEGVMTWIYDHRDSQSLIAAFLKQSFIYGWIDYKAIGQAISQVKDTSARDYLTGLTRSWNPELQN